MDPDATVEERLASPPAAPSPGDGAGVGAMSDPLRLNDAVREVTSRLAADPSPLVGTWFEFARSCGALWTYGAARMLGAPAEPAARPDPTDHRFRDRAWDDNPWLDVVKQAYLAGARACTSLPSRVPGLDERSRRSLEFAARQITDAFAPTNFLPTNPEAVRAAAESGGASVIDGARRFVRDLDPATGRLDIRMCAADAFVVGESLATTPGKVVFQNDLMQLIQYAPATTSVRRRPLLLVPPWMNKFYVMDLRPGNSMVEWLVGQGHTVFIISWVNPDSSYADKGFGDYMLEGPLAALEAIERRDRRTRGQRRRLLSRRHPALRAVRVASGQGRRQARERHVPCDDGRLLGRGPRRGLHRRGGPARARIRHPRTGIPVGPAGRGHLARGARQRSRLVVLREPVPGREGTAVAGPPVLELRSDEHAGGDAHLLHAEHVRRESPARARRPHAGGREDRRHPHHDPVVRAVDGRRSHRAVADDLRDDTALRRPGGIRARSVRAHRRRDQSPSRRKYGYRTGPENPASSEAWLAAAQAHDGSWWPHWDRWLEAFGGGDAPARVPGAGGLDAIEDAPGSYVMQPMPRD